MDCIGNYRLIEKLGQGAMGVVYRGVDTRTDVPIALKLIRPEFFSQSSNPANAQHRFIREAMAIGSLSHPGIVSLYEFGEDRGSLFLAMEFVPGVALERLIENGRTAARTFLDQFQLEDYLNTFHAGLAPAQPQVAAR